MKRTVAIFLSLLLVCGLFGTGVAEGKTYDIVYLTPSTASSFWSQVESAFFSKADLRRTWRPVNTVSRPARTPYGRIHSGFENAIAAASASCGHLAIYSTIPKP